MKTKIFNLRIVPLSSIVPHEEYDQIRAFPLIERLKKDQVLVNPIIVTPLADGKYLQLDGMNRFSAFKMMKLSSILAQIVDYNDQENVELSSWIHIFETDKNGFLEFLKKKVKVNIQPGSIENIGHRYIKEIGPGRLCTLYCSDEVYLLSSGGMLVDKIEKLNSMVSYYNKKIIRDILPPNPSRENLETVFIEHPETNMVVVFPTFTRHQIVEMVEAKCLFPPGVTRHIIRRRCLEVNAPLSLFNDTKTIVKQNEELEKLLSERSFRIYEEPTIYFE